MASFAQRVNAAARAIGGRKVLIGKIVERLDYPHWAEFQKALLRASRDGTVVLQRADLTGHLSDDELAESTVRDPLGAEYQYVVIESARTNPAGGRDVEMAQEMYAKFHRLEPSAVVANMALAMPRQATRVGKATHVLYRSGKVDPETGKKPRAPQNYIHEHDAGVELYEPGGQGGAQVPAAIARFEDLTLLGVCLGLGYEDAEDGERYEMESGAPMPELYCTPDGKCLVIVEDKREILFLVWGGALGVEPRGIVG